MAELWKGAPVAAALTERVAVQDVYKRQFHRYTGNSAYLCTERGIEEVAESVGGRRDERPGTLP